MLDPGQGSGFAIATVGLGVLGLIWALGVLRGFGAYWGFRGGLGFRV